IDHIATIRQSRGTRYPDPVQAALIAEDAGADSITVHLREDKRHIQERDVSMLMEVLSTHMNLEMAVTDSMVNLAMNYRPADCCLVPEKREELTTEGGLDIVGQEARIKDAVEALTNSGIRVSLFIDAEQEQIEAAARVKAPVIEIHTGHYSDAKSRELQQAQLIKIQQSATLGQSLGLIVNAGHGLNYHDVQPIAAIPEINELNIGHSIISRALFSGLDSAVRDMKRLMVDARS
ncbi:MAG: pyridoxine 5'-phosphate synthase, partial [Methylococcales bacterium]|nr:pyridoxine 5'-phosphate synthase [Methylococcales bacterium]